MRVFIGYCLPVEVQHYLYQVRRQVEQSTYQGNFTLLDNYHITMKYIGHATDEDIDTLECMIDDVARKYDSFHIKLGELNSFFKHHKHIVWTSIKDEKKILHKLFDSFESMMEENDFQLEQRKYHPHITIGKNIVFSNEYSTVVIPGFYEEVLIDKITLFYSHRENDVLVYTPIYERKLGNKD